VASEDQKNRTERAALERLLDAAKLPIERSSIRKLTGNSQPDFACYDTVGHERAFEMTEICAEEVAELVARPEIGSAWSADPTERVVRNKMRKKYETELPIDLVCYWGGRTVSTDDMILPTIEHVVNSVSEHPFSHIWYLGEEGVHLVASVG
jgi:hypothetical protein